MVICPIADARSVPARCGRPAPSFASETRKSCVESLTLVGYGLAGLTEATLAMGFAF